MTDFAEILAEITGGTQPLCTIKEVAFQLGVSQQTAYDYRSGNTEPSWSSVVRLSQYLIREYGYYRLAMQPTFACLQTNAADGKVNDQLLNIYEAGADLHRAFNSRDRVGYCQCITQMEKELIILKQEGEIL